MGDTVPRILKDSKRRGECLGGLLRSRLRTRPSVGEVSAPGPQAGSRVLGRETEACSRLSLQARSPTTATGTAAAGSLRAQTNSRATTASTRATGRSSATCATVPSHAPTTWRYT